MYGSVSTQSKTALIRMLKMGKTEYVWKQDINIADIAIDDQVFSVQFYKCQFYPVFLYHSLNSCAVYVQ